jgi:DNA-binding MarR family transcriptional regulator
LAQDDDPLSATFAALSHPTRRGILARLSEGEATVNELAAGFPVTGQAVSQHLQVLERAGEPLGEAVEWLLGYRRFWEEGFNRLDERLAGGETPADD